MILFSLTTFLSSFLLFVVQLIVGKRVLPWFGGIASVWTASMLFFMLFLFLGYLYVNYLSLQKKSVQIRLHLALTFLSFLVTGLNFWRFHTLIIPHPDWLSAISASPSLQILLLIITSIGLPYLLLSTTSTLLQYWYTQKSPAKSPYFLYVISNIGSFLGLILYPLIIEAKISLTNQENQWLILFFLYVFLILIIVKRKHLSSETVKTGHVGSVGRSRIIGWVSLSAISSIALLATTSKITESVSPVPFLWVLPLGLYLVSFIIAFAGGSWYSRSFHMPVMLFAIFSTVLVTTKEIFLPYWSSLSVILFTLFMINLICHAELYKSRPKPSSLVIFYTAISFGGVIAALLCATFAPAVFPDLWEFPIGLLLPIVIYLFISITHTPKISLGIQKVAFGAALMFLIFYQFRGLFIPLSKNTRTSEILKTRNFYGVLRVTEDNIPNVPRTRYLTNGTISHGSQNIDSATPYEPTTYYTKDSGGGLSILNHPKRTSGQPMKIGVIGLGAGTMAAYCQPGDVIRFYEINPQVIDISRKYFTFTSFCEQNGGRVEVVQGDARLSLEKELGEGSQKFDVLIVDAFTDDAIPVHLITKEAVELFNKHLADGGVVAFHISNVYLSLEKILDRTTAVLGLYTYFLDNNTSVWYLVSPWQLRKPFELYTSSPDPKISLWTDDHSNILEVFKNN